MSRLRRFYFETSALNSFATGRTIQDAIATKALQNIKGRGWYLSPVVLWELLLTYDHATREELIQFAQHLFEADLLPSPEELIIQYIKSGCPAEEREYPLVSGGFFSTAWRDICAFKEKTLILDSTYIAKRTTVLRDVGRMFRAFTKFDSIDISANPGVAHVQVSVQQLLDRHSVVPPQLRDDFDTLRHLRLVAFFVVLTLCAGVTLDQDAIERFWKQQGAKTVQQRVDIAFSDFQKLLFQGPFHQIAHMTQYQSTSKYSRGVYFDSMHAVYSLYADVMFTADEHFRIFRERLRSSFPSAAKIRHLDELRITTVTRENPPTESFLLQKP